MDSFASLIVPAPGPTVDVSPRIIGVIRLRKRELMRKALFALVAVAMLAFAGPAAAGTAASAYTSFTLTASTILWSHSNTLDVRAYSSYRDFDCSPSYRCDRNVMVEFVLHRGIGTYSPIMARSYGETGQYGSSATARFKMPSCKYLRKYTSQTYTVEVNAVAPDGSERQATRYVYLRSCAH